MVFLKFVLATIFSLTFIYSFFQQTEAGKPHIVFIVADDLGWNDVGFHNPDMKTPNIDKLARSGIILNQSYVQPLCSPSRHSFMTGYYPYHGGLQHLVILPWQPVCSPLKMKFLPERLKEEGYATHMVGKWHLGFCSWNCTPTYRGFDSFFGYYNAQEDYYTHKWYKFLDYRENEEVQTGYDGVYSLYTFEQKAKAVISNHDKTKPLFLYLPFQNVHDPIQVPKKYEDLYPNIKTTGRRQFSGMVSALDEAIGNITDHLKAEGLYDDTLILFTADNGGWVQYFGNNFPLRGGKFTVYEGGTRAVAFMHGAGLNKTGTVFNGLIHAVDWSHTLLEAAGGNSDFNSDGMSQLKAIQNNLPGPRDEVVYNFDDHANPTEGHAAIRKGDYKLIVGTAGLYKDWYKPDTVFKEEDDKQQTETVNSKADQYQLYNLKDDPTEHNDLSQQKPEIVKELSSRLAELTKDADKPNYPELPDPKSNPTRFKNAWSPGWC